MKTAKQTISQTKREIWMKQWADCDKGRAVYEHMAKPNPKDSINQLKRKEQSAIFKLRSQHSGLNNHLTRIGVKSEAKCPLCLCPEETVTHYLLQCPALDDLRRELLPERPTSQKHFLEQ